MAISTAQVTVGTTAVRLSTPPTDYISGSSVAITAPAAAVLYIGPAGVTAATGFPLPAGTSISLDLQSGGEEIWGVLASGSAAVSVLNTGV